MPLLLSGILIHCVIVKWHCCNMKTSFQNAKKALRSQRHVPQGFHYVSPPKFEGLDGGGEAHLSKPTIKSSGSELQTYRSRS